MYFSRHHVIISLEPLSRTKETIDVYREEVTGEACRQHFFSARTESFMKERISRDCYAI